MNETSIRKDLDNAVLTIERRFDAPLDAVWRAYTESELLDQWWAPRPWKTETVTMNFRVGGHWHYAMNGPDGEQHFGRMDYLEIEDHERYVALDVFADESGDANPELPKQTFKTQFIDEGQSTRVIVVVDYDTVDDLQKVIEMGMEQGITMAHDQLEDLLRAA
ncbi:MAG: SRPBCC domain-containing protein [Woeseiaceae bacterium]|nr:SRPBCC domain-containing protein [Woeseiaceae bacterium]